MINFDSVFTENREPDFVNDIGLKWWLQKPLPRVAEILQEKEIRWYYVENEDKSIKKHLILERNEIIKEETQLEAVGAYLDMLAMI